MATTMASKRGKRAVGESTSRPDYPYTMKLPDGRMIYVEIPGQWVTRDVSGETAFLPPAVRLLDRLKVLAMSITRRPVSPGYLKTLRTALGLTQTEMGRKTGVDKMTVYRWE